MDVGKTCITYQSWKEAQDCIRKYEVETYTKFAIYRKNISFNKAGQIDISRRKIQFEDIKEVGKRQCITFTGVPYIVLGAKYLDCIYGTDRNITTKKKRFERENELRKLVIKGTGDPSLTKKRRTVCDTKKVGCPATIVVRDIVFFPGYFAAKNTKWFRTETSKLLRDAFARDSSSVRVDRKFYVKFPSIEKHSGHNIIATPKVLGSSSGVGVGQESCVSETCNQVDTVLDIGGEEIIPIETYGGEKVQDGSIDNNQSTNHTIRQHDILSQENELQENGAQENGAQENRPQENSPQENRPQENRPRENRPRENELQENGLSSSFNERLLVDDLFFNTVKDTGEERSVGCIAPELALGARHIWTQGVQENELRECLSQIRMPDNCRFINAPPLHSHIQSSMSEGARLEEEKIAGHQMLLAKASNSLMLSLDLLNSMQPDRIDAETLQQLKVQAESSFVCLSYLNIRLLHARKENLLATMSGGISGSNLSSVFRSNMPNDAGLELPSAMPPDHEKSGNGV